jgi:hypothetical protein
VHLTLYRRDGKLLAEAALTAEQIEQMAEKAGLKEKEATH